MPCCASNIGDVHSAKDSTTISATTSLTSTRSTNTQTAASLFGSGRLSESQLNSGSRCKRAASAVGLVEVVLLCDGITQDTRPHQELRRKGCGPAGYVPGSLMDATCRTLAHVDAGYAGFLVGSVYHEKDITTRQYQLVTSALVLLITIGFSCPTLCV